ncbi:MAG: hypothetical protein ABSG49_09305 [Methanoregula sp.]|uniref:hypothetical protein n=1 Tax=Methanoregula sp. TaxID=2052170 RepID=UPI003C239997
MLQRDTAATLIQNHLIFHTGGASIKSNHLEFPPSFSMTHSIKVSVMAGSCMWLFSAGKGKAGRRALPRCVVPGR